MIFSAPTWVPVVTLNERLVALPIRLGGGGPFARGGGAGGGGFGGAAVDIRFSLVKYTNKKLVV